jgi:DNA-binding MarR family transcriptional regulator
MALGRKSGPGSQVLADFAQALRGIPRMSVSAIQEQIQLKADHVAYEVDAIVRVSLNGRPLTLLVEIKRNLFPRDARESVWRLRALQKTFEHLEGTESVLPVIASQSISPGAKDFLRSENVSYFDGGGSLFLADQDVYVLLDRPPSRSAARVQRNLFTGGRAQVLIGLLQAPDSWHKVHALSEKAFVSAATVSQVFAELEQREWISTRGKGPNKERRLLQPTALLDAWAKQTIDSPKPKLQRFFVPSLKREELLLKIDEICEAHSLAYAITAEWAAQIYSPFLSSISQVRLRFPLGQSLSAAISELKAREVIEGSNLVLLEPSFYGNHLFRERQRGVWLANPIVVYLDLLQCDGRAREMAEHLRRERIHV